MPRTFQPGLIALALVFLLPASTSMASCPFGSSLFQVLGPFTGHIGSRFGVAIADLNDDGIKDLAVAPSQPSGGALDFYLLQAPGGVWGGGVSTVTGPAITTGGRGIAAGDLNGDGRDDLAILDGTSLRVELTVPTGSIANGFVSTNSQGGYDGQQLKLADLDHDGVLDVVMTRTAGGITVGLGNGTGTFGTPTHYPTGSTPHGFALADLDGDGALDVAISTGSNRVLMFQGLTNASGRPTGFFVQRPETLFTGGVTLDVAAADLDGDGHMDLAVATGSGGTVTVHRGHGGFVFDSAVAYPVAGSPQGVVIADLDKDGKLDLATSPSGAATLTMLRGNGDGTFQPAVTFGSAHSSTFLAAGDLDGDGTTDIALPTVGEGLLVLRGVCEPGSYPVIVTAQGGGSVTRAPLLPYYPGGSNVVLTAVPAADRTFSAWSGDLGTTTNPLTVFVSHPMSLVATFVPSIYTLTWSVDGGGSVTGAASPSSFTAGTVVGLTAVPATGWAFDHWSGDATGSGASVNVTMTGGNKSVVAHFTRVYRSLDVSIVGSGTVGRSPALALYPPGTLVQLTATPDPGWVFGAWSGAASGSGNPISLSMTVDRAVSATFSRTWPALPVTVIGSGTVARSPDAASYPPGTVVQLTATAALGFVFAGWSGDTTSAASPLSLALTSADRPMTATFVSSNFALTLVTQGSGSVVRAPDLPSYPAGSVVQLTAVPDAFNAFSHWSGDASGTDPVFSLTMNAARSVTAVFTDDLRVPRIASVQDVPADNGGHVKVSWRGSSWDTPPASPGPHIGSYFVFREVPPTTAQAALRSGARLLVAGSRPAGDSRELVVTTFRSVQFYWEFVGSQPAAAFAGYSFVAPTTSDSGSAGTCLTRFLVQARTTDDLTWIDSPPDSGCSIDNLPPGTPANFVAIAAGATSALHWSPAPETDFLEWRLYRGSAADFVQGPLTFVAALTDTGYVDATAATAYYKLTGVDIHGHEGAAATALATHTTGVESGPLALVLLAQPNPSPGPMRLELALPRAAHVRVRVMDSSGRVVRTLVDDALAAGRWPWAWTGQDAAGRALPSGLYFAVADVGGQRLVRRVNLVR